MHLNPGLQVSSEAPVHACVLSRFSRIQLYAILWTVARQAPLSMGFSRQEYWSGLSFPSPGDLPNLGIELGFPTLQADSFGPELPWKPHRHTVIHFFKGYTPFLVIIK